MPNLRIELGGTFMAGPNIIYFFLPGSLGLLFLNSLIQIFNR